MWNDQNNEDFSVPDLVWHESFRTWTLSPDAGSAAYWNNWLLQNPDKLDLVNEAKATIRALVVNEPDLSPETAAHHISNIQQALFDSESQSIKGTGRLTAYPVFYWKTGLVACVCFLIAYSIFWYKREPIKSTITYQELVEAADIALKEDFNKTVAPRIVLLPDGSRVTLLKDTRISYDSAFNQSNKRKVYLLGTATFEVAKDPTKPFMVYTNGLITKVLGTKFTVHSMDSGKVTVQVLSGIVSVYSFIDKNADEKTGNKKLNALILTANQKANYSGDDKTLMATIVENPAVLSGAEDKFNFNGTPVDTVFRTIGKAYGIDVIYDEISMAKRTFTANLSTETMYEKLDIVCKTLDARYEVIDGKIVVYNNESAP